MTKYLKYLLRLSLFAIVVFIILRNADFAQLGQAFARVSLMWMLPAFLCYALRYILQGVRWHVAVVAHSQVMPLKISVLSQIEIAFLEIVFPLPDSEDGLKIAYMHRQQIPLTSSTPIILYDRMIGISILLLLLPFSFLLFAKNVLPVYLQSSWIPVVFLLGTLPFAIYHRSIISQLFLLFDKYLSAKTNWQQALRNELQKRIPFSFVSLSLALTILHALLGAAAAWLLVKSLQSEASFLLLLAGIPLYYISAILPLSIQGLGLYETALVFILKQQGIDTETAIAAGLLHFVFHVAVIVAGGVIHLFNTDKESLGNTFLHLTRKVIGSK